MTSSAEENDRSGLFGAIGAAIGFWAILGGVLLLLVVAMNVVSVLGGVFWVPFPGDFELTQIGVANAAFAFLPYCQITRANVTADIFTAWAGPRTISCLDLLASVVAFLFSLLLFWRMFEGMLDQRQYDYMTAIVQFPIWMAFLPILVSLAILAVASIVTFAEDIRGLAGRVIV